MFRLRLSNRNWLLRSYVKIRDGHGGKFRTWALDQCGKLWIFESQWTEPYKGVRYKNLSHWKATLGKILAVVKDRGLNCDRLEFLVDAPMAQSLCNSGALRLEHLICRSRVADCWELMLPTDGRMSKTLTSLTQFLIVEWELLGAPVTLVIAAGHFAKEEDVLFRFAQTETSTIYSIRSPNRVVPLIGDENIVRRRERRVANK